MGSLAHMLMALMLQASQAYECVVDGIQCECIVDASGFRSDGSPNGKDYGNGVDRCWLIQPVHPNTTSITLSW